MTLTTADVPGAQPVQVWHLHTLNPSWLRPAAARAADWHLQVVTDDVAATSERMYRQVGQDWFWVDRLHWQADQWRAWVRRPGHLLALAMVGDATAGYIELDRQGPYVEIAYFGLLADWIGQGIGGWLLTAGLRTAWQCSGVQCVWVHTCSLDGPGALQNYQARGMRVFGSQVEWRLT
jgi:GNAT superfamily N-acetyltransferase